MVGLGTARPKLSHLGADGAILLTGGRQRNRGTSDITAWLNIVGDGLDWVPYSITDWHNRLAPPGLPTYPPGVNSTVEVCGGCGWTSTYTSILRLDHEPGVAVLVYDRCDTQLCNKGQDIFAVRIELVM